MNPTDFCDAHFLTHHQQVDIFAFEWNVSPATWWIALKFDTQINVSCRVNSDPFLKTSDFSSSPSHWAKCLVGLTFHTLLLLWPNAYKMNDIQQHTELPIYLPDITMLLLSL